MTCVTCCVQATIWGDAAKRTYDPDNTPEYVHKILGPMRHYYTNEARGKQELLGSLVKVNAKETVCVFHSFL